MQWYVYLITIPSVAFLAQVALELFGRPIATALRLRQDALERLLALRNMTLPRPRETAISSQEIREYDRTTLDMRKAHRAFAGLGAQLLAFGEAEPTIRTLMALCGLDVVHAGNELIRLSRLYATANVDRGGLRRSIDEAHHSATAALAVSHRPSSDRLMNIRLEPMYLREAVSPRRRERQSAAGRVGPRQAPARAKPAASLTRRFAR
jgi:hypothetical protein